MSWENEISDECECAELIQARSERNEARQIVKRMISMAKVAQICDEHSMRVMVEEIADTRIPWEEK